MNADGLQPPESDQTEKVLVNQAKEYLHQRLQKLAPDAVLTQAWDSFYETYTEVLRRMAAEFQLDAQESEDLVQETWARVIVNLQEFQWHEHGAGLRGWLYTMIRNQAVNLIRQKVRRPSNSPMVWKFARLPIRVQTRPSNGTRAGIASCCTRCLRTWPRQYLH